MHRVLHHVKLEVPFALDFRLFYDFILRQIAHDLQNPALRLPTVAPLILLALEHLLSHELLHLVHQ